MDTGKGKGTDAMKLTGTFLSPNSMYPGAHALYRRYREWTEGTG